MLTTLSILGLDQGRIWTDPTAIPPPEDAGTPSDRAVAAHADRADSAGSVPAALRSVVDRYLSATAARWRLARRSGAT